MSHGYCMTTLLLSHDLHMTGSDGQSERQKEHKAVLRLDACTHRKVAVGRPSSSESSEEEDYNPLLSKAHHQVLHVDMSHIWSCIYVMHMHCLVPIHRIQGSESLPMWTKYNIILYYIKLFYCCPWCLRLLARLKKSRVDMVDLIVYEGTGLQRQAGNMHVDMGGINVKVACS